jgi:N-acetylmuramoyl-L-alanine amidase
MLRGMRARWLGVLGCCLMVQGVRADGQLEDPEVARRAGPPPARPGERAAETRAPFLQRGVGRLGETGALSGKTVYVSAGHGWVWDSSLGRWRTQRGNTHDLVEDFISAETIAQHLIPLLHDMGAYVVPVREADLSGELVVVDDGAATVESAASVAPDGFALAGLPLTGATNPFAGGGSRVAVAGADPRVVASWTLPVAADLEGFVYLSWVQGADRAPDAHYVIHHAAGSSHVRVDQRRHGSTWVLIGQYRFAAADPPERRRIELLGDSSVAGTVVSIDAVRVGGGASRIDRGMGTSGRPAFEDAARYQAQWNGAPASVWDYAAEDGSDDVGTRSRFSAWDHEAGEDAVYVAWHTNAPSPARGTSSFAYGPSSYGPLSEFSGVAGSLELMDAIHRELVADLRAAWEPTWQDRQQHTAYFGEVNPGHNPEMPATLIEVAFHDTEADANALREPAFRHLASRAIAQGIATYFATRDGATLTLPPGTPTQVRASGADGGGLAVAWEPPAEDPAGGDAPTGYTVYLSPDGRAFDDGHDLDGGATGAVFGPDELAGARFARVVARNAGGRSRPSLVVGGAPRDPTVGDVLVVAGFTRLDGAMFFRAEVARVAAEK